MKHGKRKITFAVLTLGWGVASDAGAADPSTTRSAPPPSGTSRAAPASPAAPATGPSRPAQPGKPDYAIALNSQQEYKNTALGWTFRVENRGNAAPAAGNVTVAVPGSGKVPGGTVDTGLKKSPAKLVISVGQPCPETKYWKALESIPLPVLQPGASVVAPATIYKMPDEYAGKGCRFQAEVQGPAEDSNSSNNVMHMITKTAMMPDLRLSLGVDNALVVTNIGNAPAGPSVVHYECRTNDPNIRCGRVTDKWKSEVVIDFEVPALKPGESKAVKGSTPKGPGATWKASADHTHQVAESNEGNNTLTGGK